MQTANAIADTSLVPLPYTDNKSAKAPGDPLATAAESTSSSSAASSSTDTAASAPVPSTATAYAIASTAAPTSVEPPRLSASLSALNQRFLAGNGAMQQFFAKLSKSAMSSPAANAPNPKAHQSFSSEQTYRSLRFENQLSLQLTTQEGDDIKVHLYSAASSQHYQAQVNSTQLKSDTQRQTAQAHNQFSFYVEGDLNAQELTAIEDYVQSLSQAVSSFFSNDLDSAVQALANAPMDGQQIARVDFSLQSKAVATYVRTAQSFSGLAPQTPAWQKLDQYFTEVLMQQSQQPPAWQNHFLEQLLPTLDWYQQSAKASAKPPGTPVEPSSSSTTVKSAAQPLE